MVSRLDVRVARAAPWAAVALASLAFAAVGAGWLAGGGSVTLPWLPGWGLSLAFTLDGLGALYALLATGVGLVVTIYSTAYLPVHLEHEGRSPAEQTRFYGLLLLFIAAMVASGCTPRPRRCTSASSRSCWRLLAAGTRR
jgi:multicomponent Na+:H+ antiporter subunit A